MIMKITEKLHPHVAHSYRTQRFSVIICDFVKNIKKISTDKLISSEWVDCGLKKNFYSSIV